MKKLFILALVLLTASVFAKSPWVDMIDCPICNNVTAEEGLSENMVWEHHLTATGMMSIFTVKPEYQDKFARAKAGMKEKIDAIMAGETLDVCGYCTSVTTLLKDGVKADNVITSTSDVTVLSSTDKNLIAKIHTHGQKIIDFVSEK